MDNNDEEQHGRLFIAGIPRGNGIGTLRKLNEVMNLDIEVPTSEEDLEQRQTNRRSRNMAIVMSCKQLPSESFVTVNFDDVTIRVQKMPFEYEEAVEAFHILAPARGFTAEFVDDFTSTLVEDTDVPADAVFLKSWTIPIGATKNGQEMKQADEQIIFLPVIKVMVNATYLTRLMARWGNVPEGTWIRSKRGFQTAVWKSVRNLKEWRVINKRPVMLPAVFIHGLHEQWTTEELSGEWEANIPDGFRGTYECIKLAGGLGLIVLSPDTKCTEHAIAQVETKLIALAQTGKTIRVSHSPAPDHVARPPDRDAAAASPKVIAVRATHSENEQMRKEIEQLKRELNEMRARQEEHENKLEAMDQGLLDIAQETQAVKQSNEETKKEVESLRTQMNEKIEWQNAALAELLQEARRRPMAPIQEQERPTVTQEGNDNTRKVNNAGNLNATNNATATPTTRASTTRKPNTPVSTVERTRALATSKAPATRGGAATAVAETAESS